MKKLSRIVALSLALVMLLTGCAVHKGSGDKNKEERIVVTSVVLCQILDKLGIDSVVGVPTTTAYEIPERYDPKTHPEIKEVGSPMGPDLELVKSLNPSIILSPMNLKGFLKKGYDGADVNYELIDLSSPDALHQSILKIGEMFGEERKAKKIVKDYEKFIEQYKKENEGKKHPRVLILMGLPGAYVAASEASHVGSLVKLAGGENVYGAEGQEGFIMPNTEDMLKRDPDIILITAHAMPEACIAYVHNEMNQDDIWKHFRAVKENKVYDLDYNKFGMSANFLYKDALKDLEPILYGE